jgi:hypothetical protein
LARTGRRGPNGAAAARRIRRDGRRRVGPRAKLSIRVHNVGVAAAAVIFDFDGLLMDTESTGLASWQYEWRQHGLELDVSTFFPDHGGDVTDDRYAKLAMEVGPSFARDVSHARRTAYRERLHRTLGLAAGIRPRRRASLAPGACRAAGGSPQVTASSRGVRTWRPCTYSLRDHLLEYCFCPQKLF